MNTPTERHPSPDIENALETIFQAPDPPEAYVDRLEQQLAAQSERLSDRSREDRSSGQSVRHRRFEMFWQRSRQLLSGAAAVAALAVLTFVLIALFSNMGRPATGGPTPTPEGPRLELEGFRTETSFGPFGGRQVPVKVSAPLPQVSNRVPIYQIEAAFDEPSAELARAWAERLTLGPVRVYQVDPALSGAVVPGGALSSEYIALADDGRTVRIGPNQVTYQAQLSWTPFPMLSDQPALDPEIARANAEAFLNRIPGLVVLEAMTGTVREPALEFRVQLAHFQPVESSVLSFEIAPLLDGIALMNQGSGGGMITVGPDGEILATYFWPLRITPTGDEVAVQPVEAVVRRFLAGDMTVMRGSGTSMSPLADNTGQIPKTFNRRPSLAAGETLRTFGTLQRWSAVDGGSDLYLLTAPSQSFVLEGEGLDSAPPFVEVEGRLIDQSPAGVWRLQVTALRPATPDRISTWSGTIRRQGDTVVLETQDGQAFRLPEAPPELAEGEWVAVPGVLVEPGAASARLEWQTIIVSPEGPATPTPAPIGIVQEVVVPVTPLSPASTPITGEAVGPAPTPAAPPTMVPPIAEPYVGMVQSFSAISAVPVTITLPSWWTYEPGEEVTLEGVFSAQGFRLKARPPEPGEAGATEQVHIEASLVVGEEYAPDNVVVVNLVGERLTEEILRLDGLHVRVRGRLLTEEEIGERDISAVSTYGQALEVSQTEQVQPEEAKAIYSGPVSVERLEGRDVALLADEISGQEYVLADTVANTHTLEMYRSIARAEQTLTAIGIVVPGETFAGRLLLRTRETMQGTGDPEPAIASLRERLENPIRDLGAIDYGPEDVLVDRIELVLSFQIPPIGPSMPTGQSVPEITLPPAEPIYRLSGRSSDGQYTVTYDLAAQP